MLIFNILDLFHNFILQYAGVSPKDYRKDELGRRR